MHIRMLIRQSECFIYVIQVIHDRIVIVQRFHDSFTPVSRHPSTVSRHPSTVSRHPSTVSRHPSHPPRVYPRVVLNVKKKAFASRTHKNINGECGTFCEGRTFLRRCLRGQECFAAVLLRAGKLCEMFVRVENFCDDA